MNTGGKTRVGMGARTGESTGTRKEMRVEGRASLGTNLRSGNRGGSEDARRRAMPRSNQQL